MKITVIGDFAFGEPVYSGQTAKCRDICNMLSSKYVDSKIKTIDTRGWKKHIFSRMIRLFFSLFSTNVYVLPLCRNGRKTILPFLIKFKRIFKYKVLFPAVGGSLLYDYSNEKKLMSRFKEIDGVFFETRQMVNFFAGLGYDNIHYLPVFSTRKLTIEKEYNSSEIVTFCTYSRVIKEKGISSAIHCISDINKSAGKVICKLDIFGAPSLEYKEEFESLLNENHDCVSNLPLLGDEAIDVLSKYYCLLFPTYYEGEGFPIALVECLKAGLPCICSDWHFNSEIIEDGITGYIFSLDDADALKKCVFDAINNPKKIESMSKRCFLEAEKYNPNYLFIEMFNLIEES